MRNIFKVAMFAWLAFAIPAAYADPIGGSNNIDCAADNCFGSLITLEYAEVNNDPQHFHITLTIDTSANTIADAFIQAVAIKTVNGNSDKISGSLLSTTAAGAWTYVLGGLANGCSVGSSGFQCVSTSDTTNVVGPGKIYEWVFDATVTSSFMLGDLASHVKVNYDTPNQAKGLQTSAGITLQKGNEVPEPHTLALLAIGWLAIGLARRRRQR